MKMTESAFPKPGNAAAARAVPSAALARERRNAGNPKARSDNPPTVRNSRRDSESQRRPRPPRIEITGPLPQQEAQRNRLAPAGKPTARSGLASIRAAASEARRGIACSGHARLAEDFD